MNPLRHSATDRGAGRPAATAGERFARALAAKDRAALRGLLADPVDFQALTPGRHWQATAPGDVVDEVILGKWFGADADIQALESVTSHRLPGREQVRYLLQVRNAAGERICWMRVLRSGYQRLGVPEA